MMMWVCRAGKKSIVADYYLETSRRYIPWNGFEKDLKNYKKRQDMKDLVIDEKGEVARTSISKAKKENEILSVIKKYIADKKG